MTSDYIYGFGTAYFDESTMGSRGQGRQVVGTTYSPRYCALSEFDGNPPSSSAYLYSVTAWKGTPNYTNTYGVYFSKSSIIRSPDADPSLNLTGLQNLGRPWNNYSTAVYMDVRLGVFFRSNMFSTTL